MQKIDVFTSILKKSCHYYSVFMKLEQFLHVKLFKNDVSEENLVKLRNHVKSKPLEQVLWNFAWKNRRLCAFRWYKAELPNMSILGTIKVSFVAVVFDDRVTTLNQV